MKDRFFDIAMILVMLVAAGVKNNHVTGGDEPVATWTLEEASFMGDNSMPRSDDRSIVQAVTRQRGVTEPIFRCGIHRND